MEMRSESGKWIAVSAAVLLASFLTVSAAAFAQKSDASSNAEISAAEAWAFPQFPPLAALQAPSPHPQRLVHMAGSTRSYTQAQLDAGALDWFPQDHPAMPEIILHDHKPARHCAVCHMVNGTGVPATAQLMGLPKAYILEQFAAFRAGQRGASGPRTTQDMAKEARDVSDADLRLAADYFSTVKFVPHTRVIETASVPKTRWKYLVQVPDTSGAREPIGERIVETPVNFEDYQYRNDRAKYVAYVPPGGIARGAVIAAKGVRAAPACESCHGANLQGVGIIPPLAGRS